MSSKKKEGGAVGGAWIPATCSMADLAVLFGVSTRTMRDLDQNGTLVRAPGRAPIRDYSVHKRLSEAPSRECCRQSVVDRAYYERAESERITRQIQDIKLSQLRGEVLTLDEVSASWSAFAAAVKADMSIPGRARSTIPHLTAHDAEMMKQMCRDLLQDLAEEVDASVVSGDSREVRW